MGGDLAVWLDESNATAWAAGGAAVLLASGGLYWQRRRAARCSRPQEKSCQTGLFTHLVQPDGAAMTLSATDRLLAKLNEGDADAAGQMFQTFEPYLRMVIRRQISIELRAKFDSTDIVQSVWADVVDGLRQSNWTLRKRRSIARLPREDDAQPLRRPAAAASPRDRARMDDAGARRRELAADRFGPGERKLSMPMSCGIKCSTYARRLITRSCYLKRQGARWTRSRSRRACTRGACAAFFIKSAASSRGCAPPGT